jgi:excisionase family DNA binding protein
MADERLTLSVEECAKRLGIGRNSAYEAVARGEIPVIRVGKRLLVPKVQLDKLLIGETPAVKCQQKETAAS